MYVRLFQMLVEIVITKIDVIRVCGFINGVWVDDTCGVYVGLLFAEVVDEGVVTDDSAVPETDFVFLRAIGSCVLVHKGSGLGVDCSRVDKDRDRSSGVITEGSISSTWNLLRRGSGGLLRSWPLLLRCSGSGLLLDWRWTRWWRSGCWLDLLL